MSSVPDPQDSRLSPPWIAVLEPVGKTAMVWISGDLDDNSTAAMTEAFDRAVSIGDAVVVDLIGVSYLTLDAAAALLMLARHCGDLGCGLQVVPSPAVRRKLTTLGLEGVIPLSRPR